MFARRVCLHLPNRLISFPTVQVLVGCKIDLRLDRAPTSLNRHFLLKQEHLSHQNSLSNLNQINNLTHNQPNQLNKTISSLHYGHFKTLALYCCRHGRLCTCYHSRICATNCSIANLKRDAKLSSLSNSSGCLLRASTPKHELCKENVIRCNRVLLKQQSPTRNSTNTEDSFSGSEDAELQSNTLSNSSCSLNGQDKSTFSNSIYRHNQSMLTTLVHQQVEQQQCANSLNSSESEESEATEQAPEDDHIHEDSVRVCDYEVTGRFDSADNHLDLSRPPVEHLQSSLEEASKSQSLLIKSLKFSNRSKLLRGYKSLSNADSNNNRPPNGKLSLDLSKKEAKVPKSSSLKQKLSTILGVNSSYSNSSLIYPSKSEKKLSQLFYSGNRKLSDTSLPLSFVYKAGEPQSSFITTEEGIKLCAKIGAQAYVECSSKLNIGVDEVFRTAIKLSIKNPIIKFQQLDMCSLS